MEAVLLMTIACLDFITFAIWLKEAVFANKVMVIWRNCLPSVKSSCLKCGVRKRIHVSI